MMRARLFLALAAFTAGCATTAGMDAVESRSGFDGGRVVEIRPHGTACPGLPCISLGAQWSQRAAPGAVLEVLISGPAFQGITRAELSIDGRVVPLTSQGATAFARPFPPLLDSRHAFGTTLATLRDVAAARRAWVRVYTIDGYLESAIVDGQADSKALHALRRFLARVDAAA